MNKIQNFKNHQRHEFDASSKDDLKLVRKYLHNHSWEMMGVHSFWSGLI